MATLFKRNKKDRNEPYKIQYVDHLGKRCTVKGFTDKGLTEQLAARLEDEARMRQTGLIDPEMEQFNASKALPLEEHVQAFAKTLADNTEDYVDLLLSRIRRTIKEGKFETFADFTLDRVQACLWTMRKREDLGNRTYNHYVQALHTFCNWCVTTKRLISNPILGLDRLNIEVDIRHKRRALKPDEMVRLIESARTSKVRVEGYRGELRARLYTVAFFTGLRRGELASLTPRSFKLGGEHPTVTVDAACSKHRREDVLPLHPDLLVLLREWLPQLKPGEKLFPGLDRKKTWKMVKKDLARIGIPYETEEGVADFHAAGRHTYITELLRNGASLPEAKELARHTDVKMTMKYTHIGLEDQSKAVAGLRLPSPEPQNPGLMDESTEGGALQMRCKFCGSEGHFLTSADAGESSDSNENPGVSRGYVAACHQVALLSKVEAPGIEPGSRRTRTPASTCVSGRW